MIQPFLSSRRPGQSEPLTGTSPGSAEAEGAVRSDRAVAYIDKNIYLPPEEKALTLERLRKWAEADDGGPVYMLNLMRYYDTVRRIETSPERSAHVARDLESCAPRRTP